jgi:hypothetical protein
MAVLPTKLPEGLPVSEGQLARPHGPNPTRAGMENHLGGRPRPPSKIEELLIEDGHGHLPVEQQIAEHLVGIWRASGDAVWKARDRFLVAAVAAGVDRAVLEREFVRRNLLAETDRK